jgi:hypothetical protein
VKIKFLLFFIFLISGCSDKAAESNSNIKATAVSIDSLPIGIWISGKEIISISKEDYLSKKIVLGSKGIDLKKSLQSDVDELSKSRVNNVKSRNDLNDADKLDFLNEIKVEHLENSKQIEKILNIDFRQDGESAASESGDCVSSRYIHNQQIVDVNDCTSSNNGMIITIYEKKK